MLYIANYWLELRITFLLFIVFLLIVLSCSCSSVARLTCYALKENAIFKPKLSLIAFAMVLRQLAFHP